MLKSDQGYAERMNFIRGLLEVFSPRDVQIGGVLVGWLLDNEVELNEFRDYTRLFTRLVFLRDSGYFYPHPTPEQSTVIRKLEREIPESRIRRYARALRLNGTWFNKPGKFGG